MTQQPPADETTRVGEVDWPRALAEHDRWLRRVVMARTGEPQAVDEVMQEVALAAVAQRSPLRDSEKVAPWLYQLAVRQSLLYRRKAGRARNLASRYADEVRPPAADNHDPLQWLLADERRERVRTALQALPADDMEILLLKYSEGWSYHQIAEHLGSTQGAVESKLHRARRKLRERLEGEA